MSDSGQPARGCSGLAYREHAPSSGLARHVSRFYEIRPVDSASDDAAATLDAGDPLLQRLLPNGDANLIFDLGETPGFSTALRPAGRHHRSFAQGVSPEPVAASFDSRVNLFGVAFTIGRAGPFLPVSPPVLAGRILPLRDLWGDTAHVLTCQLRRCRTFDERVAAVETALERRLPDALPEDGDLQAILEHTRACHGGVRVAALAAGAGLTRQSFTRWFTGAVGMGPKRFARLSRLRSVLDHIDRESVEGWSRLAVRLGYYDQAHLIGDFRWFTGMSPDRFRAARRGYRS